MKKINLFLVVFLLIVAVGCGKKSSAPDAKKDANSKEEVKKDDGSKSGSNDLGLLAGLPSNYPSDIPQPKNGKVLGSLSSSEGTVVTFESSDKLRDIIDFYKAEMKKNGFDLGEGGELLVSDKGGMLGWKKGDREVGLMLGLDEDKNATSIVITYK